MKIGFVGLGIMGKPMAMNLVRAGYDLIVNDHHEENILALVNMGARRGSIEEIASECQVLFTMLPNSPQVKEVILDTAIKYLQPGTTFIDMSSINPIDSKEIGEQLAKIQVEMLDAPVSGGEPKAIDGTVAFMVGGKEEVFEKFKPMLQKMGSSVTRCGDLGAGNTTKLANQIIVACNIQALAEALTLAQKAGVDPQCVFEAIKGGLAGSTVMNAKAPMMLAGNDKPGFRIDLHVKDLNNVIECAHTVNAPIPMTDGVFAVMKKLQKDGYGASDHSGIAHYYEELAGILIGR